MSRGSEDRGDGGAAVHRATNRAHHRSTWFWRRRYVALADHYGMSMRTIYAEIEAGRLPSHRFGGSRGALRIADADRVEWQASSRQRNGGRAPQKVFQRTSDSAQLVEKHLQL